MFGYLLSAHATSSFWKLPFIMTPGSTSQTLIAGLCCYCKGAFAGIIDVALLDIHVMQMMHIHGHRRCFLGVVVIKVNGAQYKPRGFKVNDLLEFHVPHFQEGSYHESRNCSPSQLKHTILGHSRFFKDKLLCGGLSTPATTAGVPQFPMSGCIG